MGHNNSKYIKSYIHPMNTNSIKLIFNITSKNSFNTNVQERIFIILGEIKFDLKNE